MNGLVTGGNYGDDELTPRAQLHARGASLAELSADT